MATNDFRAHEWLQVARDDMLGFFRLAMLHIQDNQDTEVRFRDYLSRLWH